MQLIVLRRLLLVGKKQIVAGLHQLVVVGFKQPFYGISSHVNVAYKTLAQVLAATFCFLTGRKEKKTRKTVCAVIIKWVKGLIRFGYNGLDADSGKTDGSSACGDPDGILLGTGKVTEKN